MSSIFSNSDKSVISSVFDDLHDSFKREIFVFVQDSTQQTVSESDFDPIYGSNGGSSLTPNDIVYIKHSILARIKYIERQQEDFVETQMGGQNLPVSRGRVRIKIHKDDWEVVKNCARIEIDNDLFILDEDRAVEGPFSSEYYSVFLRRS